MHSDNLSHSRFNRRSVICCCCCGRSLSLLFKRNDMLKNLFWLFWHSRFYSIETDKILVSMTQSVFGSYLLKLCVQQVIRCPLARGDNNNEMYSYRCIRRLEQWSTHFQENNKTVSFRGTTRSNLNCVAFISFCSIYDSFLSSSLHFSSGLLSVRCFSSNDMHSNCWNYYSIIVGIVGRVTLVYLFRVNFILFLFRKFYAQTTSSSSSLSSE